MVKNMPANEGHASSIPGSGRLPREGNGKFSSVQSLSRVRLFGPHESQHARLPCPSPVQGVVYWLEAASSSLRERKKTHWGTPANNTVWALSWHQLPVTWGRHLGYPTPMSLQLTPASSISLQLKQTVPSANCPAGPGQIPELSDITKFHLKPPSFEVVCYIAIDNQNTDINLLA